MFYQEYNFKGNVFMRAEEMRKLMDYLLDADSKAPANIRCGNSQIADVIEDIVIAFLMAKQNKTIILWAGPCYIFAKWEKGKYSKGGLRDLG